MTTAQMLPYHEEVGALVAVEEEPTPVLAQGVSTALFHCNDEGGVDA